MTNLSYSKIGHFAGLCQLGRAERTFLLDGRFINFLGPGMNRLPGQPHPEALDDEPHNGQRHPR